MKYLVEHMEGEPGAPLSTWCSLEYVHMTQQVPPSSLIFTNLEETDDVKKLLGECEVLAEPLEVIKHKFDWASKVCLLDMQAEEELKPEDAAKFEVLVLGGILGNVFVNEDGTYGSDDRTAEVRALGFTHRRHLGPLQMTTDTALITAHRVLEERKTLAEIPFIDEPEISTGECECTQMEGFRYLACRNGAEWEPVLPPGMREHLRDQAGEDLLDEFL
eukprot:GEMP01098455.1.p1 GENE.GEMP01098455.1~~GEMP01098455.1.p1  ORF type:complete len:218 (+),score=51.46 GEMP01098455.1:174-827(+)